MSLGARALHMQTHGLPVAGSKKFQLIMSRKSAVTLGLLSTELR